MRAALLMRFQLSLAVLMLFALVFSGCLSGGDDPVDTTDDDATDGDDSGDTSDPDDASDPDDTSGPGDDAEWTASIESFSADPTSGTAPVNVTFTWDVETNDENATWSLALGDGATEDGDVTDGEDSLVHGYDAGNFTATFTLTYGDSQTVEETVDLTIEAGQSVPDELVFTYDQPTLGCVGALDEEVGLMCVSALLGPEEPAIDGHWQELDESYWGLSFSVTNGLEDYQDTDCTAFNEDLEPLGTDLNNGGDACAGTLPEGTKWLFLYSWIAPSPGMELEFTA